KVALFMWFMAVSCDISVLLVTVLLAAIRRNHSSQILRCLKFRYRIGHRDLAGFHPTQPDVSKRVADFAALIFLVFFPAEKLLNPLVIDHHADETTCCKQGIDFAESAGRDALPDTVRQQLVIL